MDIDICTVNCNDAELLKVQSHFLRTQNPSFNIRYIVCDNCGKSNLDNSLHLPPIDKGLANTTIKNHKRPDHKAIFNCGNHHALGLESCVKQAASRYVILSDPDFIFCGSLEKLIEKMQDEQLAVLGATYGLFSKHKIIKDFQLPGVNDLPTVFFTIVDRDLFKEEIILDARKYNESNLYTNALIEEPFNAQIVDTSTPFQEVLHKYKYSSFSACVYDGCTICNKIHQLSTLKLKFPKIERFFLTNELVGVHLHHNAWRYGSKSINLEDCSRLVNLTVYHPLPNFL